MRLAAHLSGIVFGAMVSAGITLAVLDKHVFSRLFPDTSVEVPVLPPQIVLQEDWQVSDAENTVLLSYWAPLLAFLREDFPKATVTFALRRPEKSVGGYPHLGRSGLMEDLDKAAKAGGWVDVGKYTFNSGIYLMRGYEQSGHVFAVLAFQDGFQRETNAIRLTLSSPARNPFDVIPLIIFTDVSFEDGRAPWIDPAAPVLTLENQTPVWNPKPETICSLPPAERTKDPKPPPAAPVWSEQLPCPSAWLRSAPSRG